jgi:hypothetical protein
MATRESTTSTADVPFDVTARARALAAALFLMTIAFILTKTGRDALYFQGGGVYDLPRAYLAIAVFSVPTAFGMLGLMRRLGPRRARVVSIAALAAVLAVFPAFARPGGGVVMTSFFVLVPLGFGVLFSVSWLLAADLLAAAPVLRVARAYSLLGASAILGGMAAGAAARGLASRIDPRTFVLLGASSLGLSGALMAAIQARFPPSPSPRGRVDDTQPPQPAGILRGRYPLQLLLVGMLASLAGVLIEFQFYLAAAASGGGARENARFFANTYLILNGAALVFQLFGLPLLQRVIGVHGSLLVLPGVLLGATVSLLGSASLFTRAALRVTEGGLKASVHRVSWEQAYLPLRAVHRASAKVLVDGAATRVAEGLAALLLFLWLRLVVKGESVVGRNISWLTWVLLGTIVLWVVVTRGLARDLGSALSCDPAGDWRLAIPLPDT